MQGYYVDTDLILAEGGALPNATTGLSTAVKLNPNTNGRMEIAIYANTDITVPTGSAFSIELLAGSTSSGCSAPIEDAHVYLVHKTSADDELAFSEGDLISRYIVPENLGDYVQLGYSTDANLSTMKVDAFARVLI